MFNLFKKAETKTEVVATDYPAIIHEIHNEFLTAGDKILQEANSILMEAKAKSIEKGKRLAALGFSKVPEAVEAIVTESTIIQTKETAELVSSYSVKYPFNKFITENQVREICEKYSLVCGDISMYKGFVPENKLSVIEKFKLDKKDLPYMQLFGTRHKIDGFADSLNDVPIGFLGIDDVISNYAKSGNDFYIIASRRVSNEHTRSGIVEQYAGKWGYVKAVPFDGKLQICAPLKDMEIPQGKELKGYKIQNIPDPVVLQPVKGGYLLVACWGDEASDDILVNEVNN